MCGGSLGVWRREQWESLLRLLKLLELRRRCRILGVCVVNVLCVVRCSYRQHRRFRRRESSRARGGWPAAHIRFRSSRTEQKQHDNPVLGGLQGEERPRDGTSPVMVWCGVDFCLVSVRV